VMRLFRPLDKGVCSILWGGTMAVATTRHLQWGTLPLSLEDVRASGQPATFDAFGDSLVFLDGTVWSVPRLGIPDLPHLAQQPDAYPVTVEVGIEFGWHHLEGCDCRFCRRCGSGASLRRDPSKAARSPDVERRRDSPHPHRGRRGARGPDSESAPRAA
jgi:hypothetical protein